MVTRQTLDLFIQVRILVSQPILPNQFSSLVGESLAGTVPAASGVPKVCLS